jgi:hypothetical protein
VAVRDVGVDQADGDGLDAALDELAHDRLDLRLVDRDDALAAGVHALGRLARVLQGGRRVGLDHDDPAGQRARRLRAREVQDLREALRRDQPDAGALRLQHRVRGHGRAVHDVAQLTRADAGRLADALDADEDALRGVARCRRRLDAELAAVLVVDEEEVRERAAHVHAEAECHRYRVLSRGFTGRRPAGGARGPRP